MPSPTPTPTPSSVLTISVFDALTGAPIPNAEVYAGVIPGQTNASGQVTFSGLSTEQYNLKVSATGYTTYTETLNLTQGGSSISKNVVLTPGQGFRVTDVVSYVSNRSKEAIFLDGSSYQLGFSAIVDWNGNPPGYVRFYTPTGAYDAPDGYRLFNMGTDFMAGGRLKVMAVSSNGKQTGEFDANIEVAPPLIGMTGPLPVVYSNLDFSYKMKTSLNFIKNVGSAVPKDVPLFGGDKISFDAVADASVEVESDGTATYTLTLIRDSKGFKIKGVAFDKDYDIGGNITLRYDRNSHAWRRDGGHIVLSINCSKEIGPSYYIFTLGLVPIPIYLRGELEGNWTAQLGITEYSTDTGWKLDGILEPEAGGKVVTGVGVSSIIALEGALGAKASMQFGYPIAPLLREIITMLSGTIRMVALFYEHEWPLWEYKWKYPEGSGTAALAQNSASLLHDIRSAEWQPIPRSYSSGLSSDNINVRTHDLQTLDLASGTEQILPGQTDIYPFSTPAMTRMGNDLLLAWITDDLTRSDNNRTCVVSSRYSAGQWSAPVKIADNGTAHASPSVAAMNTGVVAAWQDAGTLFADSAQLADILPKQEIAVSIYNPATGTWGASSRLTNNGYLDRSPAVAARGDKALAVWVANQGNQILGTPANPDRLEFSHYHNGAWHPAGVIAGDQGTIVRTALVMNSDFSATLVYVKDEDGDLSTDTDQELYVSQFNGSGWSGPVRLTNDAVPDTCPRLAYDGSGNQILVWFRDGNFMMARNLDMANARTVVALQQSSGAADFQLVSGDSGQLQIVWPDASSKGQNVFMATYDPALNIWGKGIQITDTDRMERSLTAARITDGRVAVVYNSVEMNSQIRQVDMGGSTVNIEVPVTGKTDLRMVSVQLDGDLTVVPDSLVFSPTGFAQGDAVAVSATVENAGLTVQSQIPVAFYYGDPTNGGTQIGRPVIAGPLAPGDTAIATANWNVPNPADVTRKIYVVVDPDISLDDRNRANNAASVIVFQPDLGVSRLFCDQLGPNRRAITVGVSNTGNMAADNISLTLRKGSETGALVAAQTLNTLKPGEARDAVFDWNAAGEATTDGYVTFYVSVNPGHDIAESSYLNNTRSLQVKVALQQGNFPPPATLPSIPAGTTNVPRQPTLSWQGDCSGGVTYAVYIWRTGESRPLTAKVSGLTSCSYSLPVALDPSTKYQWQVVGTNSSGTTESVIWSFTTTTTPTLSPTPTPKPKAAIPDTGQTKCYDVAGNVITCPVSGQALYGQDANYSINPKSYTKLDGSGNALPDSAASWAMVRDNVTGLVWEMKTNLDGIQNYNDPHDADNEYTWYDSNPATNGGNAGTPGNGTDTEDFIKALNDSHYGGYSDWRLPAIKELLYIVDYSIPSPGPAINTGYFPNIHASWSWYLSSTTAAICAGCEWDVSLSDGGDTFGDKITPHYALAVRGGQTSGGCTDNGDGTVTDTSTGLMWQKASSSQKTWEQALAYCEGLNLGGYTDWRLPDIKELNSLLDFSSYGPAVNTTYFPDTDQNSFYWSSTTFAGSTDKAWSVYMWWGVNWKADSKDVADGYFVRAVRGEQSAASAQPTPGIKANGQAGQITVTTGTPVSITAGLEPGNENGKLADWWVAYRSPAGLYSLNSNGWTPGINLLAQYPLFGISPVEIYYSLLPAGQYIFCFGVDMSPNGILDLPLYYDCVQVNAVN